jgi:hypothetical protein
MAFFKSAVFGVLVLTATAACSAQQKFPLRAGEWSVTVAGAAPTDQQTSLLYCLNDEQWTKALTQDPTCTVSNLIVTPIGASYHMECNMKVMQMKGDVVMTFDGMEHMTSKGSFDMTLNGKTTSSATHAEYRWKGPACSPDDMNLRPRHTN